MSRDCGLSTQGSPTVGKSSFHFVGDHIQSFTFHQYPTFCWTRTRNIDEIGRTIADMPELNWPSSWTIEMIQNELCNMKESPLFLKFSMTDRSGMLLNMR
jgi:hypothetical protein